MVHLRSKTNVKRLYKYFKIYEQLYENPSMRLYELHETTRIARSTISRYLDQMYDQSIS